MTDEAERIRIRVQNRIDAKKREAREGGERAHRAVTSRIAGEEDDFSTKALKSAAAVARGAGEGIAGTADLPLMAGQYLWEAGKNAALEATGTPYERQPVSAPLTDAYNRNMPATPQGYENINDWSAILVPMAVETVLSGGAGAPAAFAQAAARQGLKGVAKQAAKAAAHSVGNTGAGIVGSQVGSGIGEAVGGDLGKEIGSITGAVASGGLKPLVARAAPAVTRKMAVTGALPGVSAYDMLQQGPSLLNTAALTLPLVPPVARGVKRVVTRPVATAREATRAVTPNLGELLSRRVIGSTLGRAGTAEVYDQNPNVYRPTRDGLVLPGFMLERPKAPRRDDGVSPLPID